MKQIKVEISWEDKNYCCGWGYPGFGAVLATSKRIENLKMEFEEAVRSQVSEMVAVGEQVDKWLENGEYEFSYSLAVSALLRQAEQFTTMAVISRMTGINQKLLSHYASSVKIPRRAQRDRIVAGLHDIGRHFMSVE